MKKNKILTLTLSLTCIVVFIILSCNKKIDRINSKIIVNTVTPMKSNLIGVRNIYVEYNSETKKAVIKLDAEQRIVFGLTLNLQNRNIIADFSKEDKLEKIFFENDPQTSFSIKDEIISYAYKSPQLKEVSTNTLQTGVLNLTNEEKILAMIFTCLYQDIQTITISSKIEKINDNLTDIKVKPFENQATIEIGCYQIGGSASIVQERLKNCTKPGCNQIATDVSCLWGNHACFGSVTYSCPNNSIAITDWEELPHLW